LSLEIYDQHGFKFFLCKADKSPDITTGHRDESGKWIGDSWQDPKFHLSLEQAEEYQKTGTMIGAWLPADVLVLDLDRHPGKPDGIAEFNKIKEQYNVQNIAFQSDAYCVRTQSGGFHVFFYAKGHTFRQGAKAPGIDLKTHAGYVIAVGSPGYLPISDAEPMTLPDTLAQWLEDCDSHGQGAQPENANAKDHDLLPASQLKRILKKFDVTKFRENDRWQHFVTSCIATAGDGEDVVAAVDEWSRGDPEYEGDRSVSKRIESFRQEGGITIGTFIAFMQEEDLSEHLIRKVIRFDKTNTVLVEAERREIKLPFGEPNYEELSYLSEAGAFYGFQGNSSAAVLLAEALRGRVIFVEGEEKRFFFFDGNRWARLPDVFQVIYTVLFRIAKRKHAEKDSKSAEGIAAVLSALNSTGWKTDTTREFSVKEGIFRESVKWDSVSIKESVTLSDGVLDFASGKIVVRKGKAEEYRRGHIEHTTAEITKAASPDKYIKFLHETFPNEDTFMTARYASSTFISGNANRRTFHLWVGEGYNGKSTWVDVLKNTIGPEKAKGYEVKILLEQKFQSMGTTPELAHFEGAYVMFGIEVDKNKRFQLGIIKALTGGDDITINPKYQHERDIKPTWQLVFACNDLPAFTEADEAFIDRLLILPFRMRYYKDETTLAELKRKGTKAEYLREAGDRDKLIAEMAKERAGIIRLMIDDYVDLVLNHRGIVPESQESAQSKMAYREENDVLGDFLRNACEIDTTNSTFYVTAKDLAEAFASFQGQDKTVTPTYMTRNVVKYDKQITRDIIHVTQNGRRTSVRALRGIRLLDSQQAGGAEGSGNRTDPEERLPF
jgi:putative DNA primase/helicase